MQLLKAYLQHTKTYSTIRFIFESFIVGTIFKFLITLLLVGLTIAFNSRIGEPPPLYPGETNPIVIFIFLCILTPLLETILFQWLPVMLLNKITSNISLIVGIDAVFFTAVHWPRYGFPMFIVVVPGAILLAWSFALYNKTSFTRAFLVTSAIHMLFNLTAAPYIFFS